MAAHDAITFDGFYSGAVAAGIGQIVDPTAADYLALTNAANACATEFDNLLNAAGTVGANANRGNLALSIALGMFQARILTNVGTSGVPGVAGPNPATAATYATLCAAAVALYSEAVGNLA